jgi:hypothetical protein
VLIGLGEFEDALELLRPRLERESPDVSDLFNGAMATWGEGNPAYLDLFHRVAYLNTEDPAFNASANFHQCLAVAWWQLGELDRATLHVDQSLELIAGQTSQEFSCWRYLRVAPDEFISDLDLLRRAIKGEEIRPKFLTRDVD